jgi:hypothetical protein
VLGRDARRIKAGSGVVAVEGAAVEADGVRARREVIGQKRRAHAAQRGAAGLPGCGMGVSFAVGGGWTAPLAGFTRSKPVTAINEVVG